MAALRGRKWLRVSGEKTLKRWNPRGGKSGDAGRASCSVAWEPQRKELEKVEKLRAGLGHFFSLLVFAIQVLNIKMKPGKGLLKVPVILSESIKLVIVLITDTCYTFLSEWGQSQRVS